VLTVDELAERLGRAPSGYDVRPGWPVREANRIIAAARGAPAPFGSAADVVLARGLADRWRAGWQPVDVWQVFRRLLRDSAAEFVVGVIAAESRHYAGASLHPRWRAQLAELGAEVWWDPATSYCEAWAARAGVDLVGMLSAVLEALWTLRRLPPEPVLIPPPGSYSGGEESRTGANSGSSSGPAAEVDPKMLAKVRALLAKAESTPFPEEADAFFAKAQELMSRYSLERAVLAAVDGTALDGPPASVRTGGRRIWLDNPYLTPKSMLVNAVARANRCRTVFLQEFGFVTVIGEEIDAEIVEVLTTSLLIQAGRAMLAAGSQTDRRGTSRTKSFRQAFLISYAHRIGERLTEASERAESEVVSSVGPAGAATLLPVLAAREEAVETFMARSYPKLVTRNVSVSNSAGWLAGRAAADLAVLDSHRAVGR
jgi:Protein of unknown function (DUF2786)